MRVGGERLGILETQGVPVILPRNRAQKGKWRARLVNMTMPSLNANMAGLCDGSETHSDGRRARGSQHTSRCAAHTSRREAADGFGWLFWRECGSVRDWCFSPPRDAALTEREFKRAPVLRKRSERDMVISPISLYAPFVAALLSSPLGAQLSAAPLPINLQMNECVLAVADADKLIDETADSSRTEAAKKQLEIARNMMDQHDAQACMTHADNAVRAMK